MRRALAIAAAVLAASAGVARAQPPAPGFRRLDSGPAGGTVWLGVIPGTGAAATGRPSVVYLPPGFSTSRRYPVVYLLHGMPGSPYEYTGSLRLAFVADTLIDGGARPFVAVAPVAGPSWRYDGEWTGPWEDYVVHDVVPWVDSHLPTIASAAGRVLAGLSAGGYGAVDIGLRHPGLFGTLESWSGYFQPLRDGTLRHADRAELAAHDPTTLVRRLAAALGRAGTRFELSTGPAHGRVKPRSTIAFAEELRSLGLAETLWVVPRGDRSPYEAQLVHGLRFAFSA